MKLIFFCEIAPLEGGKTAIVLSHKITQRMEQKYPQLVRKLEEEGSSIHAAFLRKTILTPF